MPRRTISWGGRPSIGRPAKTTRPLRSGTTPVMAISSVVLPAPLAPMIATSSPGPTSSDTSSSARMGP